ncbi:carboxy terminal-processing peptidase [Pedobacter sp. PLR]|uniref:carboxy terminal-processing peptidase n=1 Tax=Pedobacter sp. PLR TaxID=2994465 RepID=UPI0022466374|nr:carboxy terminal-processing peptidase [Pedobacter sp. PLR]MCX2453646.1 carboxy terminal-processing peptidase [Pedobacter sp. PLR]
MNLSNHSNTFRVFSFAAILFSGLAHEAIAQSSPQDIESLQKKTIEAVVRNLKQKHVRPKAIDDNFSKIIWRRYLEGLDPNKSILLLSDLNALKKYELSIDDELNAGTTDFFTATFKIYQQRLNEAELGFKRILGNPMTFSKDETIQLDGSLLKFAVNKSALQEVWRKKAKYLVLKKMFDLDKNKLNSPALEKEARARVAKWLTSSFKTLRAEYALNEKFSQYLNTITLEVDPHSSYAAPIKARGMEDQMAKRFFGIGIELQDKEGDVFVKSLRPGGVALKSGLIDINDRILRVSDTKGSMVDIAGMPITDIPDLIRGDKDTQVSLDLLKGNGLERTVSLKRAEVKDEEGRARSAIMEQEGQKIGYIYLPEFYADVAGASGAHAATDVEIELLKLKEAKVNAIIIDLRNNGGGSLDEVIKMSGFFLGKGPKVQLKDGVGVKIHTSGVAALYNGPLAVMINEQSASASEIFAAVIQDYKRGIVIGSPATYGKGTAQATVPMGKMGDKAKGIPDQSYGSLRLTEYQFYRVNGGSTQLRGVNADVVLPGKLAYLKIKEKDNVTALSWDSIPAAVYTEINKPAAWNNIINLAKEAVGKEEGFKTIDETSKLIARNQLAPIHLNADQFNKMQQNLLAYTKKIDQAAILPSSKKIRITGTMQNAAESGNEWYQQWLDVISTDLYVEKSLRIMNKVITATAKIN